MRPSIVRREQGGRGEDDSGIDALLRSVSDLNLSNIVIETAHGKRVIHGTAEYQLDRERLFEAVKELDGWETDVVIDVDVRRRDVRGFHVVQPGETLASIAEQYFGRASKEMAIFDANRDRMNDPDQIFPGQQLLIPWR
jgi:nucleoid-associated protein YgaU